MVVRLRLAMHGRKHARIFHVVAIRDQKARNAKPIELLGIYDPAMTLGEKYKTVEWSVDRIKYWLGVGAMPSKPVVRLLETGGVIPPDSKYHPKALGPRVLPPTVPLDATKANTFWQRLSDQITDSTTDGLKANTRAEPLLAEGEVTPSAPSTERLVAASPSTQAETSR